MSFTATPSTHITGIDVVAGATTVPGTGSDKYLLIPMTSLPELDEAEVTGASSNICKVAFAFIERFFQIFNAMAAADRPVSWTAYNPTSQQDEVARTATRTITHKFDIAYPTLEVADEPA